MSGRTWTGRAAALLGAAFIGATAAALIGAAAVAATTVPLHESHRNTTAAGFPNHSCAQIPGGKPVAGRDGFVFVLPRNDADFVTLTLSFRTTGGAVQTVVIPNPADSFPDGITTNGTSKAFVLVPSGWILLDGSAVVSNETKATFFNLTHTCVGTPSPSPSPEGSPSTGGSPSTSASGSQSPGTSVGGTGGGSGALPVTGAAVGGVVLTGAALVVAGVALLLLVRRSYAGGKWR